MEDPLSSRQNFEDKPLKSGYQQDQSPTKQQNDTYQHSGDTNNMFAQTKQYQATLVTPKLQKDEAILSQYGNSENHQILSSDRQWVQQGDSVISQPLTKKEVRIQFDNNNSNGTYKYQKTQAFFQNLATDTQKHQNSQEQITFRYPYTQELQELLKKVNKKMQFFNHQFMIQNIYMRFVILNDKSNKNEEQSLLDNETESCYQDQPAGQQYLNRTRFIRPTQLQQIQDTFKYVLIRRSLKKSIFNLQKKFYKKIYDLAFSDPKNCNNYSLMNKQTINNNNLILYGGVKQQKTDGLCTKICNFYTSVFQVIDPLSSFMLYFNTIFCFVLSIAIFMMPLEMISQELFFDRIYWFKYYMMAAFSFIILKMILSFQVGYPKEGNLIVDRKLIAYRYLKKHFILDILSIIPFLLDFSGISSKNTQFLKKPHGFVLIQYRCFFVLLKQLMDINITNKYKSYILQLMYLFLQSITLGHFMAYMFWGLGVVEVKYKVHSTSWLIEYDLEQENWLAKYINSLYFSTSTMTTVGYGDISPKTHAEFSFVIAAQMIASAFFAYVLTFIGEIIIEQNREKQTYKREMTLLNQYLDKRNIDRELRNETRNHLSYRMKKQKEISYEEQEEVFEKLSNSLKDRVTIDANVQLLELVPIFKKFSQQTLEKLSLCLQKQVFRENDIIYWENDLEDNPGIYFIEQGEVQSFIDTAKGSIQKTLFGTMKNRQYFGYHGFFTNQERKVCVKALQHTNVLCLNRNQAIEIIQENEIDYERFSREQNSLIFNLKNKYTKCHVCGCKEHVKFHCSFVHFIPDKTKIILKDNFPHFQERNSENAKKSWLNKDKFNALENRKTLKECSKQLMKNIMKELMQYDHSETNESFLDNSDFLTSEDLNGSDSGFQEEGSNFIQDALKSTSYHKKFIENRDHSKGINEDLNLQGNLNHIEKLSHVTSSVSNSDEESYADWDQKLKLPVIPEHRHSSLSEYKEFAKNRLSNNGNGRKNSRKYSMRSQDSRNSSQRRNSQKLKLKSRKSLQQRKSQLQQQPYIIEEEAQNSSRSIIRNEDYNYYNFNNQPQDYLNSPQPKQSNRKLSPKLLQSTMNDNDDDIEYLHSTQNSKFDVNNVPKRKTTLTKKGGKLNSLNANTESIQTSQGIQININTLVDNANTPYMGRQQSISGQSKQKKQNQQSLGKKTSLTKGLSYYSNNPLLQEIKQNQIQRMNQSYNNKPKQQNSEFNKFRKQISQQYSINMGNSPFVQQQQQKNLSRKNSKKLQSINFNKNMHKLPSQNHIKQLDSSLYNQQSQLNFLNNANANSTSIGKNQTLLQNYSLHRQNQVLEKQLQQQQTLISNQFLNPNSQNLNMSSSQRTSNTSLNRPLSGHLLENPSALPPNIVKRNNTGRRTSQILHTGVSRQLQKLQALDQKETLDLDPNQYFMKNLACISPKPSNSTNIIMSASNQNNSYLPEENEDEQQYNLLQKNQQNQQVYENIQINEEPSNFQKYYKDYNKNTEKMIQSYELFKKQLFSPFFGVYTYYNRKQAFQYTRKSKKKKTSVRPTIQELLTQKLANNGPAPRKQSMGDMLQQYGAGTSPQVRRKQTMQTNHKKSSNQSSQIGDVQDQYSAGNKFKRFFTKKNNEIGQSQKLGENSINISKKL